MDEVDQRISAERRRWEEDIYRIFISNFNTLNRLHPPWPPRSIPHRGPTVGNFGPQPARPGNNLTAATWPLVHIQELFSVGDGELPGRDAWVPGPSRGQQQQLAAQRLAYDETLGGAGTAQAADQAHILHIEYPNLVEVRGGIDGRRMFSPSHDDMVMNLRYGEPRIVAGIPAQHFRRTGRQQTPSGGPQQNPQNANQQQNPLEVCVSAFFSFVPSLVCCSACEVALRVGHSSWASIPNSAADVSIASRIEEPLSQNSPRVRHGASIMPLTRSGRIPEAATCAAIR